MKKKLSFTIVLMFCLIVTKAFSQDIIVKNDKTEIKAKVTEIADDVIKYKKFEMLNGPVFSIKKNDVFIIFYANGTKEYIINKPISKQTTQPKTNNHNNIVSPKNITASTSNQTYSAVSNNNSKNNEIHRRNSMAILFVKPKSNALDIYDEVRNIKVPDMYDDNSYGSNILKIDEPRTTNSSDSYSILNSIKEQKVANKMLSTIFYDKKTRQNSLEELFNRGEYAATDAEYIAAMNSQRKESALKDLGEGLLKNVYFQVYDVQDYAEIKSQDGKASILDEAKSYSMTGTAYLYKIDLDNLLATQEFWSLIDYEKPDMSIRNKFDNYNFPIKLISQEGFTTVTTKIKSVDAANAIGNLFGPKTDEKKNNFTFKSATELTSELLKKTIENTNNKLSKNFSAFQVKNGVYSSNPVTIKIGEKEGLKTNHLYMVTENVIDNRGNKTIKKIGWIRASNVVDNRRKANGRTKPSSFYTVAAGKIAKGMAATYTSETGIVLGLSYNFGNSLMGGAFLNIEYITHIMSGFRIGLDVGGFKNDVPSKTLTYATGGETNVKFYGNNTFYDLYCSKSFNINHFEITPLAGVYFGEMNFKTYDEGTITNQQISETGWKEAKTSSYGLLGGVNLGINLGKYFQLNAGYKLGLNVATKLKGESTLYLGGKELEVKVPNPSGLSLGIKIIGF